MGALERSLERKRSFLFDLDGTLLDSNDAHALAFRRALADDHPELARAFDYAPVRGLPTPDSFRRLGVSDPEVVARLADRKRALYRDLLRSGDVGLHVGARELVAALHGRGASLVLVTSASRCTAEEAISRTGLGPHFRGIVAFEDAASPKTTPGPFVVALTRFELDSATCLTVEDAVPPALASLHAGVDAVLVHAPEAPDSIPSFPSLRELAKALLTEEARR
jgi:beta-phosphoglucomutase-like phosphatase (HAD superfamily)